MIADKSQAVIIMALKIGKKLVSSLQAAPYLLQVQDAYTPNSVSGIPWSLLK